MKDGEADGHDKLLTIDLKKSFDILKASGYGGYCSMEFDPPGEPYTPTTRLIEQTPVSCIAAFQLTQKPLGYQVLDPESSQWRHRGLKSQH